MEENIIDQILKDKKEKFLSATKINTYLQCNLKYYFKYILQRKPEFTSPALIFGGSVHKSLEYLHRNLGKMQVEIDELFAIFENEFSLQSDSYDNIHWGRNDKDSLLLTGFRTIENYYNLHKEDRPAVELTSPDGKEKITGVELNFISPIEDNSEYKIHGIIDLIQVEKDILTIIDHKTSLKKYDKFQINTNLQLVIYSYAFRNLLTSGYKLPIEKTKEDKVAFNVLLKDKSNETIRYEREISDTDIQSMLSVIKGVIYGINNGIFLPTYSMNCAYCDFREFCTSFKPGVS